MCIQGIKCYFIEGKLSHHLTHCKVCPTVYEDYMMYKMEHRHPWLQYPLSSFIHFI